MNQQQHEMILQTTHPSGAEEWYCPTCEQRFLLTMPPNYRKIILNIGDEFAIHSGGKGGLSTSQFQAKEAYESDLPDHIRSSIEQLLADLDFDNPSDEADSDF